MSPYNGPSLNHLTIDGIPEYQIKLVKPKIVFAHAGTLGTVAKAIAEAALSPSPAIVKLGRGNANPAFTHIPTVFDLIQFGSQRSSPLSPVKWKPGDAKRKPAFLCFSSGTTGPPKVLFSAHLQVCSY